MVRFFQERFFAFDDIADLQRHAAEIGGMNERADMHVHSTFSDGRDRIEDNIAEAEALGLTALGCVDHVRVDTDWVPEYVAAVDRGCAARPRSSCAAGSRPSCSTRPARSTCPTAIDGVDAIYAADHQVPLADGPTHPREVRERIARRRPDRRGRDRRDPDLDRARARPPASAS